LSNVPAGRKVPRTLAFGSVLYVCLSGFPITVVNATELDDPTRPPAKIRALEERERLLAAGGEAAKNLPPLPKTDGVRVIVNGADRKLAVIDGELVKTKNPASLPIHPNVKKSPPTSVTPKQSSASDKTPEKRPVKVIQR
jgi:hypothetical protein